MNRKINVAELEFDQIKENLKEFMRGQTKFQDYDFEGSNMSILLDILAYNTHYNAMYTNMALNESYLDSASRRNSVVSLAKNLGYIPRSSTCSKASINFIVTDVNIVPGTGYSPEYLTCTKYTPFYGIKENTRYSFYTTSDITVRRNTDNAYVFENVLVYEGFPSVSKFEYNDSNAFIIPSSSIDTETITVKVQETPSSTLYETYTQASTLGNIDKNSRVFFVKETYDGLYQMYFGDDIIGKKLASGNIINVEYFSCSGANANGIHSLYYAGSGFYDGSGTVSTPLLNDMPTNGGRDPETIEEIRFNAPNYYASQNRAITASDYEAIILSKVPAISSVAVWGGENNVPPIYGKVFISAKTYSGRNLTDSEKDAIVTTVLDNYRTISITPEFIDPAYLDVELDVVAYYDPSLTTSDNETIRTKIYNTIIDHNNEELQKFNRILRTSVISRIVEDSDVGIISCVPRVKVYRPVITYSGINYTYTVNIGNPFAEGTILSNTFNVNEVTTPCFIQDNEEGKLILYTNIDGIKTRVRDIGTVDYGKGILVFGSINIVNPVEEEFIVSFTPSSADVASVLNQIVSLDISKLKISLIADSTYNGRALTGGTFQFTPSRI